MPRHLLFALPLLLLLPSARASADSTEIPEIPELPDAADTGRVLDALAMSEANASAWRYAFDAIAACDVTRVHHELFDIRAVRSPQVAPALAAGYDGAQVLAGPYPLLRSHMATLRGAERACVAQGDARSQQRVIEAVSSLLSYIADQPL
ncbi:MAG: hypothetical protein GAK31_00325 [Stenotrophomonas maltophilia]|uniref:Histidine kinase n=1 Tax=Stenotrophomonas maltophilia TaxID=40324 RepID=A0A7V8JN67_STEMA|nr:MAG: hypothetical protein GAK31_00325 [Stenotrophomonas maltophilia]